MWLEQKEGSRRNRERKRRERERESEREERRRQRAHSEGEKCSADDEIGGAAERANQSLFHHMSNTARNCICTGDEGGEGGRKGGREGGGIRWVGDRDPEGRRERESGRVESTECGRGGGGRMTQKSTPPAARRRSAHTCTPYWDTLYSTSATISTREKKSEEKNENPQSFRLDCPAEGSLKYATLLRAG